MPSESHRECFWGKCPDPLHPENDRKIKENNIRICSPTTSRGLYRHGRNVALDIARFVTHVHGQLLAVLIDGKVQHRMVLLARCFGDHAIRRNISIPGGSLFHRISLVPKLGLQEASTGFFTGFRE
jgi:hypothetical protein